MDTCGRYQLRKAAGKYWLLDMEQVGSGYSLPLAMNESSGHILTCFLETGDVELCSRKLAEEYGILPEQARRDTEEFLGLLREKGIRI